MKIAVFGTIPFSDLIKEGFQKLGHEISNNNADLIYANDPTGYHDATFLKMQNPKTQLILNVLDIPWHFSNIDNLYKTMIKRFFSKSDNVTAISYKVKKDLGKFFDSNIHEKIKVTDSSKMIPITSKMDDILLHQKLTKNHQILIKIINSY